MIVGGGGNDVYLFGRGYGVDTVQNGVAANGGPSSRIILGANLRPSDLWFERQGNDLWVRILVRTTPWSSKAGTRMPSARSRSWS